MFPDSKELIFTDYEFHSEKKKIYQETSQTSRTWKGFLYGKENSETPANIRGLYTQDGQS